MNNYDRDHMAWNIYYVVLTKNIQQFHEIYLLAHLFIILPVANSSKTLGACEEEVRCSDT